MKRNAQKTYVSVAEFRRLAPDTSRGWTDAQCQDALERIDAFVRGMVRIGEDNARARLAGAREAAHA